jgi:glycosyltransferase involved in cell wall biosynthesis
MTLLPEQLHVIRCYDRLPPMPGGMERHIAELTAAQRRQGVRVTEIYNSGEPAGEAIQVWRGRRLDKIRPSLLRWSLFYAAAASSRIDFSDGRVLVLHVHGDWSAFLLGRLLSRRMGARLFAASIHEHARAARWLYRVGLAGADPIFATGLQEARVLSEITGKSVIHLPSAPSDSFFERSEPSAEAFDVIVAGSLVARKNVEAVLDCAALRPRLSFRVYGDGPERERLETLSSLKGLNNLDFRGAVSTKEIHSAMSGARAFLNTAFAEGSPTAALEAMACGLPVVLTPSNDYSAIVEQGVNGRVTESFSPEALVAAIDEFLDNPARLARADAAARKTAEGHRWDQKAEIVTNAMIAAAERRREP